MSGGVVGSAVLTVSSVTAPVAPEPPEATNWLLEELAGPEYQAAQPTLVDRIASAIADWFGSLQIGGGDGPPTLGLVVIGILVIIALIVAFIIFGVPRLNRRSAAGGDLFGDNDTRTADRMRADAAAAASRGEYSLAIAECYRCIARGLAERTIVTVLPGTTASGVADRASVVFPELRGELVAAASDFDGVRYLGRDGTRQQYESMATLEAAVRQSRPAELLHVE